MLKRLSQVYDIRLNKITISRSNWQYVLSLFVIDISYLISFKIYLWLPLKFNSFLRFASSSALHWSKESKPPLSWYPNANGESSQGLIWIGKPHPL